MRTLAIDCATESCSVALLEAGTVLAGTFEVLGRGHAERLIPMIADLPGKGRADRIAVSLGPGSFTGARIGLAAARALALAWNVEAVGYPTLALIAATALAQSGSQPLTVCTTGGHGQWFVQSFDNQGMALDELLSLEPAKAAATVTTPLVVGTQAAALVSLRGWGDARPIYPDARNFGLLPPALLVPALRPIYGRAPDAKLPVAPR